MTGMNTYEIKYNVPHILLRKFLHLPLPYNCDKINHRAIVTGANVRSPRYLDPEVITTTRRCMVEHFDNTICKNFVQHCMQNTFHHQNMSNNICCAFTINKVPCAAYSFPLQKRKQKKINEKNNSYI